MLLTRSPLGLPRQAGWTAFDLHALSTPPAFVLSQDQTLHRDQHRAEARRRSVLSRHPPGGEHQLAQKRNVVVRLQCIELTAPRPEGTRSPHWLFRRLFRFQGALRPPKRGSGHSPHRRRCHFALPPEPWCRHRNPAQGRRETLQASPRSVNFASEESLRTPPPVGNRTSRDEEEHTDRGGHSLGR